MATRFSPLAKAQVADALADVLEREAAVEGANPRLGHYAVKFRELAVRILAQLGRTGAWREARAAIKGRIEKLDELMDYWLDKLYDDLEADARLVLNDPARARRAEELLDVLFPLLTLPVLIGLRPDRETEEVERLIATANTEAVREGLTTLGLWPMIEALGPVVADQKRTLEERKLVVRSDAPVGTTKEVAADFEKLWRLYAGFVADAFDEDVPAQAAVALRLRAPYDEAQAKLAALDRAALTRRARAAEAAAEAATPTVPPPAAPAPVAEPLG